MDYEKKYKEALERARQFSEKSYLEDSKGIADYIFPELKESEGEKIRKSLIVLLRHFCNGYRVSGLDFPVSFKDMLAWLEAQGCVDEDEIVKGIRRGVAISLMNHIDANSKGMCLSNMECEDIENAIVNEDWDKVYSYMKKKLEKQGSQILANSVKTCKDEQKPAWSEEDDEHLERILKELKEQKQRPINYPYLKDIDSDVDWLKSLRPQNTWKPSDEQMADLWNMVYECRPADQQLLQDLYYGLKTLRGE